MRKEETLLKGPIGQRHNEALEFALLDHKAKGLHRALQVEVRTRLGKALTTRHRVQLLDQQGA